MRPPRGLRVGGRWWRLIFTPPNDPSLDGASGICYYDSQDLRVERGQSKFDLRDTALHEALHALLSTHEFQKSPEEEERYVKAIATGLTGMFQDNPEFALWLAEPISKS